MSRVQSTHVPSLIFLFKFNGPLGIFRWCFLWCWVLGCVGLVHRRTGGHGWGKVGSWNGYDFHTYPHPAKRLALPRDVMVDVVNSLGLTLLAIHNEHNEDNIAISPYGALSILIALGEGLQGDAVKELQKAIHIPNDISIIRVGLRDIHRHLKSYFIPKEGFLAGLTLNHDNVTLRPEYEEILRFYGFDIMSFNSALYPDPLTTENPIYVTTTENTGREMTMEMTTETKSTKQSDSTTSDIPTTITKESTSTDTITATVPFTSTITTPKETTIFTSSSDSTQTTITPKETTILTSTIDSSSTHNIPDGTTSPKETTIITSTFDSSSATITTPKETTIFTTTINSSSTNRIPETIEISSPTVTSTITEIISSTEVDNPTTTEETIIITIENTDSTIEMDLTTTQIRPTRNDEDITVTTTTTTETTTEEIPSQVTTTEQITTTIKQQTEETTTEQNPSQVTITEQITTTTKQQTEETTTEQNPSQVTTTEQITTTSKQQTEETTTEQNPSQVTTTEQITTTTNQQTEVTTTKQIPSQVTITEQQIEETTTELQIPSTEQEIETEQEINTEQELSEVSMIPTSETTTLLSFPYPDAFTQDGTTEIINGNEIKITNEIANVTKRKRSKYNYGDQNGYKDKRNRKSRSVVDYLIARYYDQNQNYPLQENYHLEPYLPQNQPSFLIQGKYREYQVNYMKYDTVLPFFYVSYLKALALSFPLDSEKYYLLLLLPIDVEGLDKLICDLRLNGSLKYIIDGLRYRHVVAVIPSFMLKGYVNLTPTLQKLGIRRVFEPRQADFSPMTNQKEIYITNIEQAITVNIKNYVDPITLGNRREYRNDDPIEFRADHPFLYFVMDAELHVALMAGKIVNPLNTRIT